MAARLSLLIATVCLGFIVAVAPSAVRAEDSPGTEVENGKHSFVGQVNANAVFVRSGPRDDAYPTMKLDKGATVTVVGMKFDWLKILPPDGSFAYVPQVYVQRRGDGTVGRANREITAKVGSALNPMKIAPMATVDEGRDLTILGTQDEYFKIKPPEGSYLYVNKQFVDPVKVLAKADEERPAIDPATHPSARAADRASPGDATEKTPAPGATQLSAAEAVASSTQPADAPSGESQFSALEAEFADANRKPITEQPIPTLLAAYQKLAKDDSLPTSMKRITDSRVTTLKLRQDAREQFLAAKESQEKARARQKSLIAEKDEIEARLKQNDIAVFTAVGTLRMSSLQRGPLVMYRLTDPASGRTVAYVRTNDPQYTPLLGQFVGVRGTLSVDPALNMKVVDSPTEAQPVDPAKVNTSVAAQVIPPSLMPKPAQASVSGGDQ